MNKAWSEKNKEMQSLLNRAGFGRGIEVLLSLRRELMEEMLSWRKTLPDGGFSRQPFPGAKGYHSKTVAYSVWHIMRIEDLVVNVLIRGREEILLSGGFAEKTGSALLTTGNELAGDRIAAFSRQINLDGLYGYARAVQEETDGWLRSIRYEDLKRRFSEADKERLRRTQAVSPDESAAWLIDYWCGKDVAGLIRMPLSRHWIMHIEAAERIIDGIKAGKG